MPQLIAHAKVERIYKQQLTVVNELQKHIKSRHDKGQNVHSANNWSSCTLEDLEETSNLAEKVQNRIDEIADFQKAVTRTTEQVYTIIILQPFNNSLCSWYFQLQALLSLKQQEASIVEARIALERADESVQQGRAIMAFTIVTIFFVSSATLIHEITIANVHCVIQLPLGFFTGFFGMNNRNSTGDEWMSMREQIMYMCKLGCFCPRRFARDSKLMECNLSCDICRRNLIRSHCGIPLGVRQA